MWMSDSGLNVQPGLRHDGLQLPVSAVIATPAVSVPTKSPVTMLNLCSLISRHPGSC